MASKKRNFQAGVPVALTLRFILRLPLIAQLELKELLLQLMVKHAAMCAVDILFYQLAPNHFHVSLVQGFTGMDPGRRVGISPFVRNVMSVWAKRANSFYSTQGHLTERAFRSHNINSNEQLLANLTYTLSNELHHIGTHPAQSTHSAWGVHADQQPDGIVTAMPAFIENLAAASIEQLILDINFRAIELELQETKRPWLTATIETLALQVPTFPSIGPPHVVDITRFLDGAKHQQLKEQRLTWKMPRIKFQPRRATRIGELVEVVVRNELDIAILFT
ncbi:hypothetical protein JYT84_00580 [bacterium AH-315-M10]|nr:hypothetical protein [bacterium AH-315-M10]MBN4054981.1 hypothetical protein [Acidimicrobium ferrooxidans]